MKRFLIISIIVHVSLVILFSFFNLDFLFPKPDFKPNNSIRIEFLEHIPVNKNITQPVIAKPKEKQKPKEEKKDTSPPPKPDPAIKTKVTSPEPTKKAPPKEEPKKVTAPKEKLTPKKDKVIIKDEKKTPPKKENDKKIQETNKKSHKPDPKQKHVDKPSPGIEKKKQPIESIDSLLNNLLPDVGGKHDQNAKKLVEPDASEMPDQLRNAMIDSIRAQIQEVWSPISDNYRFQLIIEIDQSGNIIGAVEVVGTNGQSPQEVANAESGKRAATRLGKFTVDPVIFKPEYYHGEHGWNKLEIDFHP